MTQRDFTLTSRWGHLPVDVGEAHASTTCLTLPGESLTPHHSQILLSITLHNYNPEKDRVTSGSLRLLGAAMRAVDSTAASACQVGIRARGCRVCEALLWCCMWTAVCVLREPEDTICLGIDRSSHGLITGYTQIAKITTRKK